MADLCADCGNPIDWANRRWTICGKCKGAKIRKTLQEKQTNMTPDERAAEDEVLRMRGQRGLATKRRNSMNADETEEERVQRFLNLKPLPIRNSPGYVYLIQSPTKAYKIGRTKNPSNRIKTFGIQLPFEVQYVCLIRTSDMVALEATLHAYFAPKRINGEWFELTPDDVEQIRELAT